MKVTEQHANGAAIELRGTRRTVLKVLGRWREAQASIAPKTPESEPEREPDKNGAQAQVEHAGRRYFEVNSEDAVVPVVQAHTRSIGFTVRKDDRT